MAGLLRLVCFGLIALHARFEVQAANAEKNQDRVRNCRRKDDGSFVCSGDILLQSKRELKGSVVLTDEDLPDGQNANFRAKLLEPR